MAVAAVADEVDNHVFLELHAEIERELGDEQHRFRVIAVDVKNRRVDHFRDVGAVLGRACVFEVGRGETDLVVDHDVHGALGRIPAGLGHVEGLSLIHI